MSGALKRLGQYIFDKPWLSVAMWLLILAVGGFIATKQFLPPTTAITIPGTEAQTALSTMTRLFPDAGRGTGRVVFAAPEGKTIDQYKPIIEKATNDFSQVDGVAAAIDPYLNPAAASETRRIAYTQLQLSEGNGSVGQETIEGITKVVESARKDGLQVEMGGDVIDHNPGQILGVGEIAGVVLALVVLAVTLGSLVAAGLPLAVALITIGVSMAGLFSLSHFITISSTTPVLAVMLGLAVGIDYSLFIISKYRAYLLEGAHYRDALGRAMATAGNAVLFAAATVVIALAALTIVGIPFMTTMGLAGAATIALAALVAITLLPALLSFTRDRVFNKKTRERIKQAQKEGFHEVTKAKHGTIWYKWGNAIATRPILFVIAGLAVVGVLSWPALSLKLGLPTDEYAAAHSTEHMAYELIKQGFGVGANAPLAVTVENLAPVNDAERTALYNSLKAEFDAQVVTATAQQEKLFAERAASVTTNEEYVQLQQDIAAAQAEGARQIETGMRQLEAGTRLLGDRIHLQKIADAISKYDNVNKVQAGLASSDGSSGVLQVIPESAPASSETDALIATLRSPAAQAGWGADGARYGVTGSIALQNDINKKLADALPVYLAVVVGLSLILLVVAFRSIIIPIKATLGFLCSVAVMFGAIVAVFQWGWFGIAEAPGPIVSFIPIIAIGVLFGLAMDYQFFLVSSIQEAYHKGDAPKDAVVDGFGLGSKVVTAAAAIMVFVFAGFIFSHDATIQAIGFGLAIGIFIDAFVVRMTLVPALLVLLGKSAWWMPRWLDRLLPKISIEGSDT